MLPKAGQCTLNILIYKLLKNESQGNALRAFCLCLHTGNFRVTCTFPLQFTYSIASFALIFTNFGPFEEHFSIFL